MIFVNKFFFVFNLVFWIYVYDASSLLYEKKECKTSRKGAEYMGTLSVTESGLACQNWASQEPHPHDFTEPLRFPDRNFNDSANYCRNPDLKPSPWCYTLDPDVEWEACDVPVCDEIYPECGANFQGRSLSFCKPSASCTTTPQATEYVGKRGITVSDRACQRWDMLFPHTHGFTDPNMFPDRNVTEAENFCRNPDGFRNGLWCYTTDKDKEWKFCDISVCSGCKQSMEGIGYAGKESVSVSGSTCQSWTSHGVTNSDLFPDVTIEAASNYCRNPDVKPEGLWCYVGDSDNEWEFCDIPLCKENCGKDGRDRRTIKHVVHLGIDGLHSTCWMNASGGVPNFYRLTEQSTYTFRARAQLPTVSAPNWSAHMCGMGTEETGISFNLWNPPWMGFRQRITPVTGKNYPLPCSFYYLKGIDGNIRTASFTNWDWFYELTGRGSPGSTDVNYFCEGEYPQGIPCDWELVTNASSYIQEITHSALMSYTFISLDLVDRTGHDSGWCGEEYLAAVDIADEMLGVLLDTIDFENVLFAVGADHGGGPLGHGFRRDDDLLVPMWFTGPGIKANYETTRKALNRDILPTLVWAMGIKASHYWKGDVLYDIFL